MSQLLPKSSSADFVMVSPQGSPTLGATPHNTLAAFDICDIVQCEEELSTYSSHQLSSPGAEVEYDSFVTGPSTYPASSPLVGGTGPTEGLNSGECEGPLDTSSSDVSACDQLETVAALSRGCNGALEAHEAMSETALRAALPLRDHVLLPTRWDGQVPLNPYDIEVSIEEYLQHEMKHVKDVVVSQCIPAITRVGGAALGYAAGFLDDVRLVTGAINKETDGATRGVVPLLYADGLIPVDMGMVATGCSYTVGTVDSPDAYVTSVPPPTLDCSKGGAGFIIADQGDRGSGMEEFDMMVD